MSKKLSIRNREAQAMLTRGLGRETNLSGGGAMRDRKKFHRASGKNDVRRGQDW